MQYIFAREKFNARRLENHLSAKCHAHCIFILFAIPHAYEKVFNNKEKKRLSIKVNLHIEASNSEGPHEIFRSGGDTLLLLFQLNDVWLHTDAFVQWLN